MRLLLEPLSRTGALVRIAAAGALAAGALAGACATALASGLPVNDDLPAISSVPREGRTVTAEKGYWSGARPLKFSYAWLRCNSSGTACAEIVVAGQHSATGKRRYKPVAEDVGHTLRLEVTASNGEGSVSATSPPSSVVQGAAPKKIHGAVITGEAKDGQLLSATPGTWKGTPPFSYAYQWLLCNKWDSLCVDIPEATQSSYRLTTSEIGDALRVVVTATNVVGSAKAPSDATPEILEGPPVSMSAPTVTGALEDGAVLAASTGGWVGTPPFSFSYQWLRCSVVLAGCEAISGASEATYTLGPEDVADNIEVLITARNKADEAGVSASSAEAGPILAFPPANEDAPSITGSLVEGETVSAQPGTWTGSTPISYAYQWQRCSAAGEECEEIPEATAQSLTLSSADVGHMVRVEVTATNLAGSESAFSPVAGPVAAA